MATARATTVARGREYRGKRAVFIQTVQKRDEDGKTAAAKDVRAEETVFRAKNKQSDKNPKGAITLRTTIHKNLLCFAAGDM